MPKALVSYVRYIESLSERLGKTVKYGILVLLFILIYEGASRYVFNIPTPWSLELSLFVFGTYCVLGSGYTLFRGSHIRMDVFYVRWSARRRAIVDVATFSLFGVYLIVFIIGGIGNTAYSIGIAQHSCTQWAPPLSPIKIIMVVGAVLLLLQRVASFIRDLSVVRRKPIP